MKDISPKCLGNNSFAGSEPNVSCYSGRSPGNLVCVHVSVCVCVCERERERERESYSQLVPSPSECTQCAWVFDQLLEVWGQGLVSIFRGGAETRSGKAGLGALP